MKLWHYLALAAAGLAGWAYHGFDWYALAWTGFVLSIVAMVISNSLDHDRMRREIDALKRGAAQ